MQYARIEKIEAIPVILPFREKVSDSWGQYYSSNHGVVRITAQDGTIGLGEISLAWFGGAHTLCAEVERFWVPKLLGHDITQIEVMSGIMDEFCIFSKRHLLAKAGVEMALWDLWGKTLGVSVARLMGGRLRDRVSVTGGIPMSDPQEMAETAAHRVGQGYRELKLKIGLDDHQDLAGVMAVRRVIPDEVRVRVDVNMAWKDRRHALQMMDRLWDIGVQIVEQPLASDRLDDLRWLRERVRNRILLDEGVWSIADAKTQLDAETADMLHLYTCEAGGLACMRRIAELAELYNVPCTIGSMPEGRIGTAASAQAAAFIGNLSSDSSDIRGFTVYAEDLTQEELVISDGELIIPDKPGLGVTLDEEKLAHLRVGLGG